MSYLQFLNWLVSLADKLPQFLEAVQALADWYAKYIAPLIPAKARAKAAKKPSARELKAEQAVQAMLAAHSPSRAARGIGGVLIALRAAYEFLKDNPQLMAMLLSLFGKKV